MLRSAATFALPVGFALCALLSANTAEAEASYMDLPEAVEAATAIAVIHTEASAPCQITGEHWTYSQKVFAEPTEVLKGDLATPFELLAGKDFICASVSYDAPADYLVMLHEDGEHLTTLNHSMGALRIDNDRVEWPYGAEETIRVVDALAKIRALVGEQPQPATPDVADVPVAEPRPCGYAVSRVEEEEARETWMLAGAIGGGAAAVMLGFVFAFRRRRRS